MANQTNLNLHANLLSSALLYATRGRIVADTLLLHGVRVHYWRSILVAIWRVFVSRLGGVKRKGIREVGMISAVDTNASSNCEPDEFAAQWQRPSSLPTWIPQPEPSVKATLTAHSRAALTDEPGRRPPT